MNARDALFAEARRTPLTRGAIEQLASRLDLASVAEHAPAALEAAGAHVATVLACALVAGGKRLPPAFARALLPELDRAALVGPIAFATDADPDELLLGYLDEARGTVGWDREALAALLVADGRGASAPPPPPKLLVHARRLARNELGPEASVLLGAAAIRIGDKDLLELAAPFVTKAKKGRRAIEDALASARRSVLEALGDVAPRVVGGDYTVRKHGPDVGRNDPCPCGSGKKYKKCCALDPAAPSGGAVEAPRIDEATLHPEQVGELRASELGRLEVARVPTRSLPSLLRKALGFRRWAFAERVLAELATRSDRKGEIGTYRLELLDHALEARDGAVAETELAKIGPDRVPPALRLDVACVRGQADVRAIEEAALAALRGEHEGLEAIELAFVLLRNFPALGIFVARGALHEGRVDDSTSLLQAMEDARDRLLVSPFEPWWELYEALVADARERKKARVKDEEQAELARELRRARAESRGAAAEVERMRRRLEELDASLAQRAGELAAPAPAPSGVDPESARSLPEGDVLEEERKRLRGKVEELQRIIGEGQDERRELRQRLTQLAERPERAAPAATGPAARAADGADPERDEDASLEDGVDERPRGILVPVFSDRAAKSVGELGGAAADAALALVAALAACRENAWGSVKRLTKARSVYSARAGIHHRILFGIDERALRVHDVIHRRDLEQAVNRLVRAS